LTGGATTPDADLNIEETCVLSHSQREQYTLSLRWHHEVLQQGSTINRNFTASCLHVSDSQCILTLTTTPSFTFVVELGLSWLLGKSTSEIEEIDPVKLSEIVWVNVCDSCHGHHDTLILLLGVLRQMIAQVVLEVRILLERVEQDDFLTLVCRQVINGVVSVVVLPLHLVENLAHIVLLSRSQLVEISLIVKPLGSHGVTVSQVTTLPEQFTFSHILHGDLWLLKQVMLSLEILRVGFRVKGKLID
jgi:hypothetical protein